jgi:hypothetical protein
MLSEDMHMVLNMERHDPSTTVDPSVMTSPRLSGYIDYTAIVTKGNAWRGKSRSAGLKLFSSFFCPAGLLDSQHLSDLKTYLRVENSNTSTGFFIVEAKFTHIAQWRHVPQAIYQMYAFGKYLE